MPLFTVQADCQTCSPNSQHPGERLTEKTRLLTYSIHICSHLTDGNLVTWSLPWNNGAGNYLGWVALLLRKGEWITGDNQETLPQEGNQTMQKRRACRRRAAQLYWLWLAAARDQRMRSSAQAWVGGWCGLGGLCVDSLLTCTFLVRW